MASGEQHVAYRRRTGVSFARPSPGNRPRLCVVGPMLGSHPGLIPSQGEMLSSLFRKEGFAVVATSSRKNRYRRFVDIVLTLLRSNRLYDVQVLNIFGGPSFVVEDVASSIAKRFGKRVVMVLRGGAIPEFMRRHPSWSVNVLSRAEVIVVPSLYLARAIEAYGLRSEVIPNVVNIASYPFRHRHHLAPRLFWMRTFHPIWNPLMAVRVLKRVREHVPECTLVMGGEDKYGMRAEVEAYARSQGVLSAIRFAGFLDPAGKVREAAIADIFINTNTIDNMPVSVIEACAFGLPVVSTNVGGVPDLLTEGKTGLMVPSEDDAAMAEQILRLLRDPDLAATLSANARLLAESCSWDNVRPLWEKVLSGTAPAGVPNNGGNR